MIARARGTRLRGWMTLGLIAGLLAAIATLPAPAAPQGQIQVDVKLVIATDVSHSIDEEELHLQRQGIADVFLDPTVVRIIESGPIGRVAVAMAEWAGYRDYRLAIPWTIIEDKKSAAAFAAKVVTVPTLLGQRTSLSNAIESSIDLLNESDGRITATRKVIDISGDGPNNDGVSLDQVHQETRNNGIVINGLPIMDENSDGYFPDLDRYYAACVVAGEGAFLVVVRHYKDFGDAMRRKLIFEVAQNGRQMQLALQGLQRPPVLENIVDDSKIRLLPPQLRGPAALYPDGCDKYGGWHRGAPP